MLYELYEFLEYKQPNEIDFDYFSLGLEDTGTVANWWSGL